ncbi:MAG: hypothetical protein JSW00_11750 [Thermoplasmata archaeon]|nr:MAG: hypothetical protein JSW00_11750 [Thermoplasmata archaeon]
MRGFIKRVNRPWYVLLILSIMCSLILALAFIPGQSEAQSDEVHVFIDGPNILQTNGTAEYTIKITGGPAEEAVVGGNWSYVARLEGEDPSTIGGILVPENATSEDPTFKINVTAPDTAQTITLIVNGSSFTNASNIAYSGDVIQIIEVFEPIPMNITATIKNPTQFDVKGAVISFYVDGTLIGNQTVDVPANSTETVNMKHIFSKADEGEHEIEIRINEAGNLLEFENGDNVLKMTIYVGDRPAREVRPIMIFNSGLVFFLEVIAFFFFIAAFFMRRRTIMGRGYYSPGATRVMYVEGMLMTVLSIPVFYVSQVMAANPDDVSGDPVGRLIEAVFIFIMGFLTILLTWDRTRKKRR